MKTSLKRMLLFIMAFVVLSLPAASTNVTAAAGMQYGKYHSSEDTSTEAVKVLDYGKDMGLGIKALHAKGYTGRGVTVAIIDQPVLTSHEQFRDLKLHYSKIRENDAGMRSSKGTFHGTTVLSILAGNTIGVAPESEVYYIAHPSWIGDYSTDAEGLRKLIEINKTLATDKKIRVVSMSITDLIKTNKNVDDFRKAIQEAEDSGIMVFTCNNPFNSIWEKITYPADKNDPKNYKRFKGDLTDLSLPNTIGVPNNGITTATEKSINDYTYWENDGGSSWQSPFVAGLAALGLQIDSSLTKAQIVNYMMQSATIGDGGVKLINPEGFVNLVRRNAKAVSPNAPKEPYYYVLYNSLKIDNDDWGAIKEYAANLDNAVLKDVASYPGAIQVYEMLKEDSETRNGKLKGIQIFGSSPADRPSQPGDVPSFNIGFCVQNSIKDIDNMGYFNTDFFYSTFLNDSSLLQSKLNVHRIFKEKLKLSLIPEWPVVRLPLNKGEIAPYLKKHKDYVNQTQNRTLNTVNFSNPIFPSPKHQDDMGQFIQSRLDKEFHIINSSQYRLYGNLKGLFPVQTKVLGDFTKENLSKENAKGIINFFINTHGQPNNIDQAIFDKQAKSSDEARRVSLVNNDTINQVLNKNYYNMILWTCNNGYDLRNDNITHKAMTGYAVNIFASSTVISNRGVNNAVSFEDLKKNNFYYFQYVYFYFYYQLHQSMSDSFFAARKAYIEEILKNTNLLGENNYQFNLNNALQYQDFGVIEKSDYAVIPAKIPNLSSAANSPKAPSPAKTETRPGMLAGLPLDNTPENFAKSLSAQVTENGKNINLTVNYNLDIKGKNIRYSVFNPGGGTYAVSGQSPAPKGTFKVTIDKAQFYKFDGVVVSFFVNGKDYFYLFRLRD